MLRSDYTPLTRKKDEMIKCENDAHPECPLAQACRHAGCREGSQAQVRPRAFSWRAGAGCLTGCVVACWLCLAVVAKHVCASSALPFRYNEISGLEEILEENPGQLAAIVVSKPV